MQGVSYWVISPFFLVHPWKEFLHITLTTSTEKFQAFCRIYNYSTHQVPSAAPSIPSVPIWEWRLEQGSWHSHRSLSTHPVMPSWDSLGPAGQTSIPTKQHTSSCTFSTEYHFLGSSPLLCTWGCFSPGNDLAVGLVESSCIIFLFEQYLITSTRKYLLHKLCGYLWGVQGIRTLVVLGCLCTMETRYSGAKYIQYG